MTRSIIISIVTVFALQLSHAKEVYKVPFGSAGNTIELTVENASSLIVNNVRVSATKVPSWMQLSDSVIVVDNMKPRKAKTVTFLFSIDKDAPVNSDHVLLFTINTPSGEEWTKEINISVSQPERFELFQNFPNPFNPETKIEYTLPTSENVRLIVYDVLGRETVTLVDGVQEAGFKSVSFNASNLPSGVYFYRIQAGSYEEKKKMMLMR